MQNEGIGDDGLSKAPFNPDFRSVVSSLGTVGPVSSLSHPRRCERALHPSAFLEAFFLKGKVEGVSEREMCYAEPGENMEITSQGTWVSDSHPSALFLPGCRLMGAHGQ